MILFLVIVALLLLFIGIIYVYLWISEFIDPEVYLQNITVGNEINVKDGFHKFNYGDVNNIMQLNNGIIEVDKNKIISVIGYKEYDSIFDDGNLECSLDLEHFNKSTTLEGKTFTKDSLSGYIGKNLSPSKVYVTATCDKISDMKAKLTVSLSEHKILDLNSKTFSNLDYSVIDSSKWVSSELVHTNVNRKDNLENNYKFLNYSLGSKLDFENLDYVIYEHRKFYKVNFYGFENHGNEENEEKINELANNTKNIPNSIFSSHEINGLANAAKRKNHIEPEKYYVSINDDGFIDGIYASDKSIKNYGDRVHYDSMNRCVNKLNNYASYLISEYPLSGKTESFSTVDKLGNEFLEKYIFNSFDKKSNVHVELTCNNVDLYNGSFMFIKFEKK